MVEEKNVSPTIAVAIPCYNEGLTIAQVIDDFRRKLPEAEIYVFDNNSSDDTVAVARRNGAKVIYEKKQGKGYAMQRMFRTVDSDILIMVDGDGTYFADDVSKLIEPIVNGGADMTVGNRLHQRKRGFSYSHRFGNAVFRILLNYLFNTRYQDILSGYRAMKKDFYQGIPLLAGGFEVETELTLQSLDRGYSIMEIPVDYTDRPQGSYSKISKFRDGSRIILTIVSLLRDYRPMIFFSYLGGIFIVAGVFFGSVVIKEYYLTGFITRVPTAILSIAFVIVGVNAIVSGLILSAVSRRHKETEAIIRQISNKLN
jgi:glycosyltransferase involved in cell wall biosynthesis